MLMISNNSPFPLCFRRSSCFFSGLISFIYLQPFCLHLISDALVLSSSPPPLWARLLSFRSCWVCFATDEDDRTAEWVRPCRCRGSTKWVHQACLQRWVDEKQRGNSTARVACPQCNAEYLIVFPKLGEFTG